MITSTNPITPPKLLDELTEALDTLQADVTLHQRAFVGIMICLDNFVDTKRHIISVLQKVGFNPRHIAMVLDPRKGPFKSEYWLVDAAGRYEAVCDRKVPSS